MLSASEVEGVGASLKLGATRDTKLSFEFDPSAILRNRCAIEMTVPVAEKRKSSANAPERSIRLSRLGPVLDLMAAHLLGFRYLAFAFSHSPFATD